MFCVRPYCKNDREVTYTSGDIKSDHLKSIFFKDPISNVLVVKW